MTADEILILGAEHEKDSIRLPISAGTDIDSRRYARIAVELGRPILRHRERTLRRERPLWPAKPRFAWPRVISSRRPARSSKSASGSGFKAPTLSEMFQNFPDFGFFGNPDLKPESSIGYDRWF